MDTINLSFRVCWRWHKTYDSNVDIYMYTYIHSWIVEMIQCVFASRTCGAFSRYQDEGKQRRVRPPDHGFPCKFPTSKRTNAQRQVHIYTVHIYTVWVLSYSNSYSRRRGVTKRRSGKLACFAWRMFRRSPVAVLWMANGWKVCGNCGLQWGLQRDPSGLRAED